MAWLSWQLEWPFWLVHMGDALFEVESPSGGSLASATERAVGPEPGSDCDADEDLPSSPLLVLHL